MAIDWASVSPWTIPDWAQLAGRAEGAIPNSIPNMTANVGAGMSSPLLQQILGPMMQRLQAPQQLQQQNLTDAFRSAGGLSGSAYGGAYNQLLQQQGNQTNDLMASVMQSVLSPLLQAFNQNIQNQFLPTNAMTNILQAGRPSVLGFQQNAGGNTGGSGGDSGGLDFLGFPTGGGGAGSTARSSGGGGMAPQQGGQLFGSQPSPADSLTRYGAGDAYYTGGSPTQQGGMPITGPGSAWDTIMQQLSGGGGLGDYGYSGDYGSPSQQPAYWYNDPSGNPQAWDYSSGEY